MARVATKTKSIQQEKVDMLKTELNKMLGAGTISTASEDKYKVSYWSTGLLPIDVLLQGGFPKGRFVEIFGPYSSLKSYVGLCTIAQIQSQGGTCAVIDTEHSFDADWATSIGVNNEQLLIQRPKTGEEAMDTAETLVRGGIDFVMFDSVAAALPQDENKKRLHDNNVSVARLAALMSVAMRKLTTANSETSFLWINQTRVNVGVMFGSNEATPGGKALPFYASYRVRMSVIEQMKREITVFDGEKPRKAKETYGQKFKAEIVKSKLSAPFRDTFFDWNLEGGYVDIPTYLMSQGVERGFVTYKGPMWTYGKHVVRGREAFREFLRANPDVALDLENKIRREAGIEEVKASLGSLKLGITPKAERALIKSHREPDTGKRTLKLKRG